MNETTPKRRETYIAFFSSNAGKIILDLHTYVAREPSRLLCCKAAVARPCSRFVGSDNHDRPVVQRCMYVLLLSENFPNKGIPSLSLVLLATSLSRRRLDPVMTISDSTTVSFTRCGFSNVAADTCVIQVRSWQQATNKINDVWLSFAGRDGRILVRARRMTQQVLHRLLLLLLRS